MISHQLIPDSSQCRRRRTRNDTFTSARGVSTFCEENLERRYTERSIESITATRVRAYKFFRVNAREMQAERVRVLRFIVGYRPSSAFHCKVKKQTDRIVWNFEPVIKCMGRRWIRLSTLGHRSCFRIFSSPSAISRLPLRPHSATPRCVTPHTVPLCLSHSSLSLLFHSSLLLSRLYEIECVGRENSLAWKYPAASYCFWRKMMTHVLAANAPSPLLHTSHLRRLFY